MEEKLTTELDKILENTRPEQLSQYLDRNRSHLADEKRGFYYFMANTLAEKNIRMKDVFSFAGVSESYGSKIISMEKHTRQRDLILRLCIAGHFTLQEINRALKLYGVSELYARDPRDACIIVAVNNRIYDLGRIDELLEEQGFEKLSKTE